MKKHKVVHLTSVHPRYDARIYIKMCSSLALSGFDVSLVVSDGLGCEVSNDVDILDVGIRPNNRLKRMIISVRQIYKKAIELDADIYHLHDPELMPIGVKLKRHGKKVIFDAHEDFPKQLLGKYYLNPMVRYMLSKVFSFYERIVCRKFDAIVAATPSIRDKFSSINSNSVNINNYPLLDELKSHDVDKNNKSEVSYIGNLSKIRGGLQIVQTMSLINTEIYLNFCGKYSNSLFENELKGLSGWTRVIEHGIVDREGVRNVLSRTVAGIVTFLPLPNHLDSQPNKMFEYMSAGIPVIASNFPLWREIIEKNNCGLCVDPLKPEKIAQAIDYLVLHPDEARLMGENGRQAVLKRYNWDIEEKKLLNLYKRIISLD